MTRANEGTGVPFSTTIEFTLGCWTRPRQSGIISGSSLYVQEFSEIMPCRAPLPFPNNPHFPPREVRDCAGEYWSFIILRGRLYIIFVRFPLFLGPTFCLDTNKPRRYIYWDFMKCVCGC